MNLNDFLLFVDRGRNLWLESLPDNPIPLSGESGEISMLFEGRPPSLEEFLALAKVDREAWEVATFRPNAWQAQGPEGRIVTLWQLKAQLDRKAQPIEAFLRGLVKQIEPLPPPEVVFRGREPRLMVVGVGDPHIGKRTRDPDFHRRWLDLLRAVQDMQGHYLPSQIAVVLSGDILHIDNVAQTTTAGTPVGSHIEWEEALDLAGQAIGELIHTVYRAAPTQMLIARGNHDYHGAWYLAKILKARFPGLEVKAGDRVYYRWEQILLGVTHGNAVKKDTLPMIMAKEVPQDWGLSEWREFLIGHYHRREELTTALWEPTGVRVRVLRALQSSDRWHLQRGYLSAEGATILMYNAKQPIAEHEVWV